MDRVGALIILSDLGVHQLDILTFFSCLLQFEPKVRVLHRSHLNLLFQIRRFLLQLRQAKICLCLRSTQIYVELQSDGQHQILGVELRPCVVRHQLNIGRVLLRIQHNLVWMHASQIFEAIWQLVRKLRHNSGLLETATHVVLIHRLLVLVLVIHLLHVVKNWLRLCLLLFVRFRLQL